MLSKSILIADDDEGMLRLLSMNLQPLGAEIMSTRDAFSALVVIREHPPNLAIIDVNMPAGNGLSVCEMLVSDPTVPRVPIIVLTGQSDDATRMRCQSLGLCYVQKGSDAMNRTREIAQQILGDVRPEPSESQLYIG